MAAVVQTLQTTHTYDILLASMRFQRLTIQKLSVYSPPVLSLFNSVFLTIFTIAGTTIRIWSAVDGGLVSEFKQVTETVGLWRLGLDCFPPTQICVDGVCVRVQDIISACFDDRERKIILGTQNGMVEVLNCMNGSLMKSGTSHSSEVTMLRYCKEDKCLISVGWDRQIMVRFDRDCFESEVLCLSVRVFVPQVHDEEPQEGLPLLRTVVAAHDADVTCCDFSYNLGVVVTGSRDTTLKLWDFQDMRLECVCQGHTAGACIPSGPFSCASSRRNVFVLGSNLQK